MSEHGYTRRNALALLATGSGAALLGSLGCGPRTKVIPTPTADPAELDLVDAGRAVRDRSISPVDLTRACLRRIERFDPRLNAFITVTARSALAEARLAEQEIAKGRWRGPLHGIPIALKDNIDTAGLRTTAGSELFANRVPARDAEVVLRLKAAGAVFLGKLNLHELGIGANSAISHFGPVHNPWNFERIAGGSSGGSAAAVAAGLCFGALGTDTGGSIRIPAACCGIVGLKPSFGVVGTQGVIPMSPSFDHVGPMARTVADTALLFRAMTDDPAAQAYDPQAPPSTSKLRIGVLPTTHQYCDAPAVPEVQEAFDLALEILRPLVAEIRPAELPVPDLGALIDAEAYAYHATFLAETPQKYDARTHDALLAGKGISQAEADRLRRELERHRAAMPRAFERVDLMVIPTLSEPAIALSDVKDPYTQNVCTFAFSIGGLPAISVPCGVSKSGLPIGLQIVGPPRADARVLALAQAYESVARWQEQRPPLARM